jgi:hypothetical protein
MIAVAVKPARWLSRLAVTSGGVLVIGACSAEVDGRRLFWWHFSSAYRARPQSFKEQTGQHSAVVAAGNADLGLHQPAQPGGSGYPGEQATCGMH